STVKAVTGCNTSVDPTCATDLVTTNAYVSGGGPLSTTSRPGGGSTAYAYDSRGRMLSLTRDVTASVQERIENDYDASGRKSAERYRTNASGSWVTTRSESFVYDEQNRLTATV